ncbi:replicative DNA helicase [Leucobacter sp. VD1]|uniref:replicative DNA helicase n=1 Tax=Leucobacter sp. VD1 TaxID=3080381 RepID=UPI0030192F62
MTVLEYDPQTEAFMLGAVFDQPSRIWEVRQIVRESDFAVPRNSALYSIMCDVADRGGTVSPITVNDRAIAAGRSHEFDATYPHEVYGLGAYGYQAMQYAEIVRRHGERRRLSEAAAKIQAIAAAGDDADGDIVEQASSLIDELRDGSFETSQSLGDVLQEALAAQDRPAEVTQTPWPSLNALIDGVRRGGLYTVAARSGAGKSIFALQLALHIAEKGQRVVYISLEMSPVELVNRLVALMQGVNIRGILNSQLTPQGREAFADGVAAIGRLPLDLREPAQMQWKNIQGIARAAHRQGDLGLVVIDYLGMIPSPPGSRSRPQDLADMANDAKRLARELNCAVLIVEQLNRNMTNRPNPRPMITDLKGSSGLENASDTVLLLHRGEKKVGGKVVQTSDVDFIVAKARQGETGVRTLRFEGQFARIVQKEHETTALIEPGEV